MLLLHGSIQSKENEASTTADCLLNQPTNHLPAQATTQPTNKTSRLLKLVLCYAEVMPEVYEWLNVSSDVKDQPSRAFQLWYCLTRCTLPQTTKGWREEGLTGFFLFCLSQHCYHQGWPNITYQL